MSESLLPPEEQLPILTINPSEVSAASVSILQEALGIERQRLAWNARRQHWRGPIGRLASRLAHHYDERARNVGEEAEFTHVDIGPALARLRAEFYTKAA